MLEANLYLPLYKGANAEGWALYRIADGTWGKKPFDIGGVDAEGRAVALEVKVLDHQLALHRKIPWGAFRPHQITWLRTYAARKLSLALAGFYEEPTKDFYLIRVWSAELMDAPINQLTVTKLSISNNLYRDWPSYGRDNVQLGDPNAAR